VFVEVWDGECGGEYIRGLKAADHGMLISGFFFYLQTAAEQSFGNGTTIQNMGSCQLLLRI
jgi:hypothetical protein